MIMNAGKTELCDMMANVAANAFAWIAYGTGTTAEVNTQTALVSESSRVAATVTLISILSPDDTLLFRISEELSSALTIAEVGIFNAASSGDMLARKVLDESLSGSSGKTFTCLYYITAKDGGAGGGTGY